MRRSRSWTVESLAAATEVSRATLARRFLATVGNTPAAHLTRWRMDLAAQRLRNSDDTVAAIARSVGYGSESAFSRAFTRSRGIPPGRYRTHSRPSDGSEVAKPADPARHTGSVSSTPHPAMALSARASSGHAVMVAMRPHSHRQDRSQPGQIRQDAITSSARSLPL